MNNEGKKKKSKKIIRKIRDEEKNEEKNKRRKKKKKKKKTKHPQQVNRPMHIKGILTVPITRRLIQPASHLRA